MAEFPFGVKVGKKVRKDKEDKIFELFKVYEESIKLKDNYIQELQKEIKNLQKQLSKPKKKKDNKIVIKPSEDNNKRLNKWLEYYNLVKDSAVDLNGEEIKDISSYGREYMDDIINVRKYLKIIFMKFNSVFTLQQFRCNILNPTWYDNIRHNHRGKLIKTLKRLDISLDIFLNSKIVKHYFI